MDALVIDDAELICPEERSAKPMVLIEVNCIDLKIPFKNKIAQIITIGILGLIKAQAKMESTDKPPLTSMTDLNPKRCKMGEVTTFIAKLPIKILRTMSPAEKGSIPNPSWKSKGIKKGIAFNAALKKIPALTLIAKVGMLNNLKSTKGCLHLRR
jgi:hypothetical protein